MNRPFDPRLFLIDQELDRGVGLLLASQQRLLNTSEKARKAAQLSRSEFQVLMAIFHDPGRSVSALRARIGMTTPTFARIIGALDARGLIRREATDIDARRRRLTLSTSGEALLAPALDALRAAMRSAYRDAGADAVEGTRTVLEALAR